MISSIALKNFRCFEDHTLEFQPLTITVGKNNAGKSTMVEALRIVSIITARIQGFNFHEVPDWLDLPKIHKGAHPSLGGLQINTQNISFSYGDPPSEIIANFNTGDRIHIYIGEGLKIHALIFDKYGNPVTTRGKARTLNLPKVSILPQIGPLIRDEKVLTNDYVKGAMASSISSSHFRNQLKIFYSELYADFKKIAEESWYHLQIQELEGRNLSPNGKNTLSLYVREKSFVAEIGWMGHGLQMWLQIMWFLTYSKGSNTVILDEPDVYMHADLQRKLLNVVKGKYPQTIITTHSVEIMSEVNPSNVLIVDRNRINSSYASSLPDVQNVIENFGGIHNIQLARLWNSKKLLLVEGKDVSLLKIFHALLFPITDNSLDTVPNMSIGGWSGWPYVIGSSMLLKNSGGESIITYCLFDSDYHTSKEIRKRKRQANMKEIQLHIWTKKELENFLVVPRVIARLINTKKGTEEVIEEEVSEIISQICEQNKNLAIDNFSTEILNEDRSIGVRKANQKARAKVDKSWNNLEEKISIVSGKTLLSKLSQWSKEKYNVSFGSRTILNYFKKSEIPTEIKDVLTAIEENKKF